MSTENNVTFSREKAFDLITPVEKLYTRDVESALADADQTLIREGYWVREHAVQGDVETKLYLITQATSGVAGSEGVWRMVWVDGDRHDVAWSAKLTVIINNDFIGKTKQFDDPSGTTISPGDLLTVYEKADAIGAYGHLELAASGEIAVARCLTITDDWLVFQAISQTVAP